MNIDCGGGDDDEDMEKAAGGEGGKNHLAEISIARVYLHNTQTGRDASGQLPVKTFQKQL